MQGAGWTGSVRTLGLPVNTALTPQTLPALPGRGFISCISKPGNNEDSVCFPHHIGKFLNRGLCGFCLKMDDNLSFLPGCELQHCALHSQKYMGF